MNVSVHNVTRVEIMPRKQLDDGSYVMHLHLFTDESNPYRYEDVTIFTSDAIDIQDNNVPVLDMVSP